MKRTLVFALAMASLMTTAHAADADLFPFKAPQLKDPLPDSLTWYGVTFFATLDLGYAYQTNGRPLGNIVSGLEFVPFTTTRNYTGQRISTIAHSGLEQSKVGLKVDQPIAVTLDHCTQLCGQALIGIHIEQDAPGIAHQAV